jgi:signal transduction histidine kinase
VTFSALPRPRGQTVSAASRTSWQGSLVDRALRALANDYRRPTGPIAIAVVLTVAAVMTVASRDYQPPLAALVALLATVPIAVIRRYPATAIWLVLSASAVFLIALRLYWPVPAIASWLIALAAAPLMLSRKAAIRAFALTEGAVVVAASSVAPAHTPWDATIAEALAVIAAWGAGEMLRSRRQVALDQAAAAQQLKDLSERDVLARERASIARELHDVVAHHVSMIAVRAGTAPYAIADLPEPGQEAFGEIAAEARAALTELRVVLGVLRDPAKAAEATPQPRLADIDAMLARVRSAGTRVTAEVAGQPRALPDSVELCGYRIVQEAVTNAGRHAPGSRVSVVVAYLDASLGVVVRNTASPAVSPAPRDALPTAGFGLTGLRERVAMLGGEIAAGPEDNGGFAVRAVLPAPRSVPAAAAQPATADGEGGQ